MNQKKPKPNKIEMLNWNECTKWIEQKLGYNVRDTLGKFSRQEYDDTVEYRDFWHFICDHCSIQNPCQFWLPDITCAEHKWQKEILQTYLDEFGEGPYWVAW